MITWRKLFICFLLVGAAWNVFDKQLFSGKPVESTESCERTRNSDDGSSNPRHCIAWNIEDALRNQSGALTADRRGWVDLINDACKQHGITTLRGAEVGVFKGQFASKMLSSVPVLEEYILVDPWKHLDDWNKPLNKKDDEFKIIFEEAMRRTQQSKVYGHKVKVIRGTSSEGARQIQDGSLDFVYVDGDHTAKGAMKDILLWAPKVKCGGLIFGDDYMDSLQHGEEFDPTMVKSAVDAYTEVMGIEVYDMGSKQFGFVQK